MGIYDARNALAARLKEIEEQYPEDDLRGGDYGRYSPTRQAELRAEKKRLIEEAKAEAERKTKAAAAAQKRKAQQWEIGGGKTKHADPAALQMVRQLRSEGRSDRDLIEYFDGDPESLTALRRAIELDGVGTGGATKAQARQLGASEEDDADRRKILHLLDRKLYPDYAKQAEQAYEDTQAAEALERGVSSATAVQVAQLARRRLG